MVLGKVSAAKRKRKRRILFRKVIVALASLGILAAIATLIYGSMKLFKKTINTDNWEYAVYAEKYSEEYDVPIDVIYAVIETESHFDENAQSPVGACGLMQLMPETYEWILGRIGSVYGSTENETSGDSEESADTAETIFDPQTNIRCGVYYLSYLYERFGVWETVYAGYNAGPTIVSEWLNDSRYSSDSVTLISIPYTETSNYVQKVSSARIRYQEQFSGTAESVSEDSSLSEEE